MAKHHQVSSATHQTGLLDTRGIVTGVIVGLILLVLGWIANRVWGQRPQLGVSGMVDRDGYVRIDVVGYGSTVATISKVEIVARRPITYRVVQAAFHVQPRGDNAIVASVVDSRFSVEASDAARAFGVMLDEEALLPSWWNPFAKPSMRRWRRAELRLKVVSNQRRRFALGEERDCRYVRVRRVHGHLQRVP
jgi:hypothetical protein